MKGGCSILQQHRLTQQDSTGTRRFGLDYLTHVPVYLTRTFCYGKVFQSLRYKPDLRTRMLSMHSTDRLIKTPFSKSVGQQKKQASINQSSVSAPSRGTPGEGRLREQSVNRGAERMDAASANDHESGSKRLRARGEPAAGDESSLCHRRQDNRDARLHSWVRRTPGRPMKGELRPEEQSRAEQSRGAE